jgi:predicted ATPase/class 3 adenylate cyclase
LPFDLPTVAGVSVHRLDRRTNHEDVFAGTDLADGQPVRVRLYQATYPTSHQLAWRRHAVDVGRRLAGANGVLCQRMLVPVGFDLALVTDAPEIDELDRWSPISPAAPIDDHLRLAVSLTQALAEMHDRGITHNALAPMHLGVDTDLRVRIGGLHRAMNLRSEASGATNLRGSLAYISPEQTGRMNRPVDARSDLYALGAILFELFSGHPPFVEVDDLALVHAHVARSAPRLSDAAYKVPDELSELVGCLLEKNPDHRYQTAQGVLYDLEYLASDRSTGEPVPMRTRDISEQLVMSEHLYGREMELDGLTTAFDRACSGEQAAVMVAGYSGIGKSRLVHEIEPMVVERFGWFAEGKFDQYRRDLPYAGWTALLEAIVRQILILPTDELVTLRAAIGSRLGPGAADLAGMCRDVEHVVGEQPVPSEATPIELQMRLTRAVTTFIDVVASPKRPLVLFLDDLQWADLASLRLLESMLIDPLGGHLMVLGAWRENEITADHPVRSLLRKLGDAGRSPEILHLAPLEVEHVHLMVADALHQASDPISDLGTLIHDKTAGNPFFVRQFLEALHREGALRFDRSSVSWTWSPEALLERTVTDNVADLLAGRLAVLSPPALVALQAAAVIGARFRLSSVMQITGQDPLTAARALDEALTEQLVTPLDDRYRYAVEEAQHASTEEVAFDLDPDYAFLHDRVQQAAIDTLDDSQRKMFHLARARALAADDAEGDDLIIDIASHLCEAVVLIHGADLQLETAATVARAAQRAKSTMAIELARRFLDVAIGLLPPDAWTSHYELSLRLRTEAADVAYIDGRYDDVASITAEALARAKSALDRVPIHNIVIGVGVARADYAQATQYALDVLAQDFHLELTRHPSTSRVGIEMARCRAAIGRRNTQDLLKLPPMRDAESIAVMGILMKTATNAYWAEPNLVPIIACRMIRLSLAKGNDSLSAYGYALYAMVSGAVLGAENTGYAFGKLSMDLLEAKPNRSLIGRTALLWHGFVRHSRDPVRDCVSELLDSYHAALDAGDVENACYCATVAFYADTLTGRSLDSLLDRFDGYVGGVMSGGQAPSRAALAAWLQVAELLRSAPASSSVLVGQHVDWPARRQVLLGEENGTALPTEGAAAAFLAFLFDDLVEAERNLRIVYEYRSGAAGQPYLGPMLALYAATILRRRGTGDTHRSDQARLAWIKHLLRVKAKSNPHDMEVFRLFVDAESYRAMGDRSAAVAAYLDTAAEAQRRGVLFLEALALDEAGALEAEAGHVDQAGHLVSSASEVWRRYGVPARAAARIGAGEQAEQSEYDDDSSVTDAVDIRTILENVQAVSREIEVAGLLTRVISLVIRNAGATRGVLMLVEDGAGRPVATGSVEQGGTIAIVTGEGTDGAEYVRSVVDYVIRTGRAVLIDDATTHELVRPEPRFGLRVVGSILCTPLVQAGNLVGVVYLENHVTAGVFTSRQLVLVETICGQAAVSLNNARLFEEQRSQAESFARFVPRPFLEQLGHERISDVGLGDAVSADLTVSFSDLRDFTKVSEEMSAGDSFKLLNAYLGRMGPVISSHGGIIDKYVGDAVMSLFMGASDGAVTAAIDMQEALRAFNAERPDGPPLRMGLGLHSGEVMLGTVGFADRLETTVIGDTVNTASRVEGASKLFCGGVLVTRAVLDRLLNPGPFLLREVGRIRAVGKSEVVEVHEVLAARPGPGAEAAAASREVFADAQAAWYRADFAAAADLFHACSRAAPLDELARQYARRSDRYLDMPPEAPWHGIEVMEEK